MNAYNDLPDHVDVYDKDGKFIGVTNGYRARCTAKTNGSVQIRKPTGEEFWYSGKVNPYLGFWKLTEYN